MLLGVFVDDAGAAALVDPMDRGWKGVCARHARSNFLHMRDRIFCICAIGFFASARRPPVFAPAASFINNQQDSKVRVPTVLVVCCGHHKAIV